MLRVVAKFRSKFTGSQSTYTGCPQVNVKFFKFLFVGFDSFNQNETTFKKGYELIQNILTRFRWGSCTYLPDQVAMWLSEILRNAGGNIPRKKSKQKWWAQSEVFWKNPVIKDGEGKSCNQMDSSCTKNGYKSTDAKCNSTTELAKRQMMFWFPQDICL